MDRSSPHNSPLEEDDFSAASFSVSMNLPAGDTEELTAAAEAVRREYRASCKWKRLRCREVLLVNESETGSVYELKVGVAVEFDWTWEGAVAFRPAEMRAFEEGVECGDAGEPEAENAVWRGEVLEVDEAAGRLFVLVEGENASPKRGSFYVRPFEFLAWLDRLYNDEQFASARSRCPAHLGATKGGASPVVSSPSRAGLPALSEMWGKSWGVLWGPPGTGKTYTLGRQVAAALKDPGERLLVVSTTNKATDQAALQFGAAAKYAGVPLGQGQARRIGKTANLRAFREAGLVDLLRGTETELLGKLEAETQKLGRTRVAEERALIRKRIRELREEIRDASLRNFLNASVRVVVATAFKATMLLGTDDVRGLIERGQTPFTTVLVDEAGLVSRAAAAALSLLAARRFVLVGDPKQLAPISKISRVLERGKADWLAKSALTYLDKSGARHDGVHLLREQHRMHPEVCEVVSRFHYDGLLTTADTVRSRETRLPSPMADSPRAIWCVLDEQSGELPPTRPERGPGGRSWVRAATLTLLARLFAGQPMRSSNGLFISPYRAQARAVGDWFASAGIHSWTASTVHSQQGAEADVVLFDTVNAGSYAWPYEEWKRLVNVALSRARLSVVVLATRSEMRQPYLSPLTRSLAPRVLVGNGASPRWAEVSGSAPPGDESPHGDGPEGSLGRQLVLRRTMRPVMSREQQRLCGLKLDGKPRLVRGVAGSGKTAVLASWLMQTVGDLAGREDARVWAVFANRSLQSMIQESVSDAWEEAATGKPFPGDCVAFHHVHELLDTLLPEAGLSPRDFRYDYDSAAEAFLDRVPVNEVKPRCDAMFLDEAQDMGPSLLKLLAALVQKSDPADPNSRAVNIFYDNAQNIYGRPTPRWSELGVDLRGRSTVMRESFRSPLPITEFALNVLYRLQPPTGDPEHRELVRRGLIEPTKRRGADWWRVRFTQVDGPAPTFRQYGDIEEEVAAIGDYLRELIVDEGVRPADICVLYNGKNLAHRLETQAAPSLAEAGIGLAIQTSRGYDTDPGSVLVTTSHSFKGYDAEVVVVAGVDQYKAKEAGVLANNLYVAMTRARSVLTLFAQTMRNRESQQIYGAIRECLGCLAETPAVERSTSAHDDLADLLNVIGWEHQRWLTGLWRTHGLKQEPLVGREGAVLADPLFSYTSDGRVHACFGPKDPPPEEAERLAGLGVRVVAPGEVV